MGIVDILKQKEYFVDPVFGLEKLKFSNTDNILSSNTASRSLEYDPNYYIVETKKLLKEKPELKNILAKYGFVKDDGRIDWPSHTVNNFGFRSDDWGTGEKGIIFLGCSDMFGLAQYLEHTTAYIVSEHFNLKNYNLSIPGGGLDQCYRVLKYHIENINSDTVVLLIPEASRRVFYTETTEGLLSAKAIEDKVVDKMKSGFLSASFLSEVFFKLYSNEYEMFLHANKNIDAIKYICEKHNKKLIIMKNPAYYLEKDSIDLTKEIWTPDEQGYLYLAADLCHFGAKGQKSIANKIISKF